MMWCEGKEREREGRGGNVNAQWFNDLMILMRMVAVSDQRFSLKCFLDVIIETG